MLPYLFERRVYAAAESNVLPISGLICKRRVELIEREWKIMLDLSHREGVVEGCVYRADLPAQVRT